MPLVRTTTTVPKIFSVPVRIVASVRNHGLRFAWRRARRRLGELIKERRLGIRTVGSIDAAELKTGSDSFGYQPIPYAAMESALQAADVNRNDVFIDVGCGMGRAVVLAGLVPQRRVIGVEISPQLCELARQNVAAARSRLQTPEVEIIQADAGDYVIPDEATVLLLFNPFDEPILRRVLDNIQRSIDRNPRDLKVIYAIPAAREDILGDVPWLQLEQTLQIPNEDWLRMGIYRARRIAV